MLSKCEIHNQNTVNNYVLDSAPAGTGYSSVRKFDVHGSQRAIVDRHKQQAHGTWAAKNYRTGMSIDIEGTLQADTPAHVLAQNELLTYALFGDPTDVITNRYMGTIFLRRLDKTEDWKANFTVDAFTAPITAESTVIEYLITLFCWDAWFTGVTSNGLFYWN